jgi:hypothetical protein
MFMTYGRGRAEQFRVNPTPGSTINFAPPLFCLYLVDLLVLALLRPGTPLLYWSAVPLGFYLLAVIAQTLASMPSHGIVRSLAAMPWLAMGFVLYGLGFWRGLFTTLKSGRGDSPPPVALETVPH